VVTATRTIRPCEAGDLDGFERLGASRHAEYCREQFSRGTDALTILVAVEDGRPVGKLHLDFGEPAGRREAVLIAAAVARQEQSRGIVLDVEDFKPRARRPYERLGYVAIAEADFRYAGAPVPNPGVWMRKELPC
jgi:hypothetical protein